MKKLWNKLPAWLKAVILNLIMLFPPLMVIQSLIDLNREYQSSWPWALFTTIAILLFYVWLVRKWHPIISNQDVKLRFYIDLRNPVSWSRILGLTIFTASMASFCYMINAGESTVQTQFFEGFLSLPVYTAIPLFFAISLTAGVLEEVTYRGVMQNILMRKYSKWVSFLIIAVLFAVLHQLPLHFIVPYMIISIMFSLVADEQKNLGLAMIGHTLIDTISLSSLYFQFTSFVEEGLSIQRIAIITALLAIGAYMIIQKPSTTTKPLAAMN